MKHYKYKTALLAGVLVLMQVGFSNAQKKAKEDKPLKTITIDLKGLEAEISDIFKTVAFEISKIDLKEVGAIIEEAGREIGDIKIVVDPDSVQTGSESYENISTEVKTKNLTKTYSVGRNDKLSISNQYGNVDVKVWTKNEIKVDVEIKAFESSESAAEDLLQSVKITELQQTNLIGYKTVFGKSSMSSWKKIIKGKEERRGVEVNYTVFMPSSNPLELNNRYGSITMGDFQGPINIVSTNGTFKAGTLNNTANSLKVTYGTADVEKYLNGNMNISYGSLNLGQADKMNASVKYSKASIEKLTGGGNFDVAYSLGFKIGEVDKSVKNLLINSSYSGLVLGIDKDSNTNFDVTVSYGGFNYKSDQLSLKSNLTGNNSFSPTKTYTGTIGNGSDSKITVKSSYGSVKFL